MKKSRGDQLALLADTVILKARDAKGEQLFRPEDKQHLMRRVDSGVLERIASEIAGDDESIEDLEGNFEATTTAT